jgi:outer membrane autotransporter protein
MKSRVLFSLLIFGLILSISCKKKQEQVVHTIGEKFGKMGVTAGFDRYTKGNELNKWSLVGSYDIATISKTTVAVKAGAVYLDNMSRVSNGYAALVGAGVSYPLTKTVALTADYRYQAGQSSVNTFDGSTVAFGAKYSF